MQQQMSNHKISVIWRGKKFILEMNSAATVKDLAYELQKLTDVKADTMRLIVPQASDKSSKLLSPFSEGHSHLSLQEAYFFEGKSFMMMGVPKDEVDELLQNAKANMRIAGFEEEESRLRQRMLERPHSSLKLPQGKYIFCEFRTLHLPGVELDPPASEALRRMHMLAADPGIVAIMNKHCWRVGIMSEMPPVGYVGVSPKCILGFNTNQGEEISLRLRTDDLKGFRKYQMIKKTLLHELAHMVYSEHDASFFALNKQLNQEAAALDWTRSNGHTLTGIRHSANYEEILDDHHAPSSKKLGGKTHDQLATARAASVAAAYQRLENVSPMDKDNEDSGFGEPESMDVVEIEKQNIENSYYGLLSDYNEPDPDDYLNSPYKIEPDPDDIGSGETMESEAYSESAEGIISSEPDPDNSPMKQFLPPVTEREIAKCKPHDEPDPDDLETSKKTVVEPDPDDLETSKKTVVEPDPDDSKEEQKQMGGGNRARPDQGGIGAIHNTEIQIQFSGDDKDQVLQRIQDPVTIICTRLQSAIEMLQSEVGPTEIAGVLQTLFRIIRNLIEHPSEMKFKRIRKDNPVIQRNVANYRAAIEILSLIGFNEDVMLDEIGRSETYFVLKRNDPVLLWLAKSSLETCIAY